MHGANHCRRRVEEGGAHVSRRSGGRWPRHGPVVAALQRAEQALQDDCTAGDLHSAAPGQRRAVIRERAAGCGEGAPRLGTAQLHESAVPTSSPLRFVPFRPPADEAWAAAWPHRFEALYTVCLAQPDPPELSEVEQLRQEAEQYQPWVKRQAASASAAAAASSRKGAADDAAGKRGWHSPGAAAMTARTEEEAPPATPSVLRCILQVCADGGQGREPGCGSVLCGHQTQYAVVRRGVAPGAPRLALVLARHPAWFAAHLP